MTFQTPLNLNFYYNNLHFTKQFSEEFSTESILVLALNLVFRHEWFTSLPSQLLKHKFIPKCHLYCMWGMQSHYLNSVNSVMVNNFTTFSLTRFWAEP